MMLAAEKPVGLTRIDREYAALWTSLEHDEPELPLGRAITANLIVVGDASDEDALIYTIDRVLLRHPCRAFLILRSDRAEALTAHLGIGLRPADTERIVVVELLTLSCGAGEFGKLPGLLRPLLVQDLPVQLFWARGMPDNAWELATMARLADHVVVDSSRFSHPRSDRARLQAIQGITPVDLAWLRLRPWRRALAEAFEHVDWQESEPTQVRILHGAGGAVAAAHLLGDWLARRLRASIDYAEDPAPVVCTQPCELELQHGEAHVSIRFLEATQRLQVSVTLADRCLLPFCTPASLAPAGDLLAAAMDGG